MTSRERLLTAIQCRQPDRVPVHVWGVQAWQDGWIEGKDNSFRPVYEAVKEKADLVASWSCSAGRFLSVAEEVRSESRQFDEGDWVIHEATLETPAGPLVSRTRVSRGPHCPMRAKHWVENEEDLRRFLSLPYVPAAPSVDSYFQLREKMGDRGIVKAGFSDPIAGVHDLLGSELLAVWSLERRPAVRQLIDLFTERLLALVRHLTEGGVDAVYAWTGAEYCGPPLMSPRDFREFVTEPCRQLFRVIRDAGHLVHVHCHGPLQAILEDFAEMGVNCLHPIEAPPLGDMPLAEAKRRIGDRVCLEGNLQIGDLFTCSARQVRDLTRQAIDDGAEGGGFILCPTASPYYPVLNPRAVENYLTMIETALEFGEY
jgi:uroporphyrinogen-III decarboxylase